MSQPTDTDTLVETASEHKEISQDDIPVVDMSTEDHAKDTVAAKVTQLDDTVKGKESVVTLIPDENLVQEIDNVSQQLDDKSKIVENCIADNEDVKTPEKDNIPQDDKTELHDKTPKIDEEIPAQNQDSEMETKLRAKGIDAIEQVVSTNLISEDTKDKEMKDNTEEDRAYEEPQIDATKKHDSILPFNDTLKTTEVMKENVKPEADKDAAKPKKKKVKKIVKKKETGDQHDRISQETENFEKEASKQSSEQTGHKESDMTKANKPTVSPVGEAEQNNDAISQRKDVVQIQNVSQIQSRANSAPNSEASINTVSQPEADTPIGHSNRDVINIEKETIPQNDQATEHAVSDFVAASEQLGPETDDLSSQNVNVQQRDFIETSDQLLTEVQKDHDSPPEIKESVEKCRDNKVKEPEAKRSETVIGRPKQGQDNQNDQKPITSFTQEPVNKVLEDHACVTTGKVGQDAKDDLISKERTPSSSSDLPQKVDQETKKKTDAQETKIPSELTTTSSTVTAESMPVKPTGKKAKKKKATKQKVEQLTTSDVGDSPPTKTLPQMAEAKPEPKPKPVELKNLETTASEEVLDKQSTTEPEFEELKTYDGSKASNKPVSKLTEDTLQQTKIDAVEPESMTTEDTLHQTKTDVVEPKSKTEDTLQEIKTDAVEPELKITEDTLQKTKTDAVEPESKTTEDTLQETKADAIEPEPKTTEDTLQETKTDAVEPESKITEDTLQETKTDAVEPESKTTDDTLQETKADAVEPESKTTEDTLQETKTDEVEPESQTEETKTDAVEPESKTTEDAVQETKTDEVEPESKTKEALQETKKDAVEPESKVIEDTLQETKTDAIEPESKITEDTLPETKTDVVEPDATVSTSFQSSTENKIKGHSGNLGNSYSHEDYEKSEDLKLKEGPTEGCTKYAERTELPDDTATKEQPIETKIVDPSRTVQAISPPSQARDSSVKERPTKGHDIKAAKKKKVKKQKTKVDLKEINQVGILE